MFIPLLAGAVAVKDVDNVHVKDRTRYVTDMAGMLSPGAVARVDSLMADAWRQSSAEPVVVIVDNLAPPRRHNPPPGNKASSSG